MSQRYHLLSTSIMSSDYAELREAAKDGRATVVEVAEANNLVPLPWLACFRPGDLHPCAVSSPASSEKFSIPCIDLPTAVENLLSAYPLFEQVTGDNRLARDYWRNSVRGLLSLQLPFVALDLRDMLGTTTPQEFNAAIAASLGASGDVLTSMKGFFFEYHIGVLPYDLAEFLKGSAEPHDEQRTVNTVVLNAAIRAPSPSSFWGDRWRSDLNRRSLGIGSARRALRSNQSISALVG